MSKPKLKSQLSCVALGIDISLLWSYQHLLKSLGSFFYKNIINSVRVVHVALNCILWILKCSSYCCIVIMICQIVQNILLICKKNMKSFYFLNFIIQNCLKYEFAIPFQAYTTLLSSCWMILVIILASTVH